MRRIALPSSQRGATLIVALIMLLLFTLMVSSAFTMSGTNLKAVANMQSREEAIAAANMAVEILASGDFSSTPAASSTTIDLNNDGVTDYTVQIAKPVCVNATMADATAPSSAQLIVVTSYTWNTVWDIQATVTDPVSGASVKVRSGIRVLLSEAKKKNSKCPTPV